jgi:hypothetical protein
MKLKSTMSSRFLSIAGCLAAGAIAFAAVNVDDQGIGFVGKGDVQLAFDWNNAQLQENAAALQFRICDTQTYTWQCEWTTGPDHNRTTHTSKLKTTTGIDASVAFDARKNKNGQITGFNLNGFEGDSTVEGKVMDCGGAGAGKTLVADSLQAVGEEESDLQVSADGGATWVDLAITQ